jgi:hypothetical protein
MRAGFIKHIINFLKAQALKGRSDKFKTPVETLSYGL